MKRKFLTVVGFATGIFAGSVIFRRSFAKPRVIRWAWFQNHCRWPLENLVLSLPPLRITRYRAGTSA